MLSVYSNLPKYRQLSYFELNQPKWKLETSNKWMKCFLDTYISHIMCLRKQKKLFSSADTANKIHHLKSPLMLSVYHNLLYINQVVVVFLQNHVCEMVSSAWNQVHSLILKQM